MGFDVFDNYECEGQLSVDDVLGMDIPENIFAVSKIFARARTEMNLPEFKAFTFALSNFKFTENNSNVLMLDKKQMAAVVGINYEDSKNMSVVLKRSIGNLPKHSFVEFDDPDHDFYENGAIISKIRMYKNKVWLKFDEDYMKLFTNLEKDYITMWSGDIYKMKSERSIIFYEDLRLNSDTRITNSKGFGIKALKELFDIPKDGKGSYMRKDGHFDRPAFERYVLDPLCEDLTKCKMINLLVQEDGKYYEKVKQGGRVLGYRFYWTISEHPQVATAAEVKEIEDSIQKNPEVMKVAKDIVNGQKKEKKAKKNSFADVHQREYDYEDFEKMLLTTNENVGK